MYICLTVDSDWAHPEVTFFALDILEQSGVPFTFFATDDQDVEPAAHREVALHPNFTDRDPLRELARLAWRFPDAAGLRPHRLAMPPELDAGILRSAGMQWISAHHDVGARGPGRWDTELPDAPIHWGDNLLFLNGIRPDMDTAAADGPGMLLYNFHPIHLYLNTCAPEQYAQAKPGYLDPEHLKKHRNEREYGVRNALEDILDRAGEFCFATVSHAIQELAS
ncbi:MAG: hypothetical protein AB7E32_02290 [Desulfovibrio sp.]